MGTARPLYKIDHAKNSDDRCADLQRKLVAERRLRKDAERKLRETEAQVKKFHALLIQARVALINKKGTQP